MALARGLLWVMIFVSLPVTLFASEKHQTTSDADLTRTSPIPYPTGSYAVWIYTKFDSTTGYQQVYMQYHNPLDATGALIETRLTSSSFDKFNPQWGPDNVTMRVPSVAPVACLGQIFLFTGDGDTTGVNHLYIDCLQDFPSFPSPLFPSLTPLTGIGAIPNYDVADYDIEVSQTFPYNYGGVFYSYYEVILTTSLDGSDPGEMHHLLFRPENMDLTGKDYHLDTTRGSSWRWGSWSPSFIYYRTPRFFNGGNDIVFAASDGSVWQLGAIQKSGRGEVKITNLARDVVEPKVYNDETVVFGIDSSGSRKAQLAYTRLGLTGSRSTNWCREVHLLTEDTMNRNKHDLNQSTSSGNLEVTYIFERPVDGYHDVYYAAKTPTCNADTSTPVTDITPDYFDSEIELTCDQDNHDPHFMPAMNSDRDHVTKTDDPVDIIMLEAANDGSDAALVHLHNNPEPADCLDTCEANADGTFLTDDLDGDGLRDGILRGADCDNCNDVSNPDQADSNRDGTGDACEEDLPTTPKLRTEPQDEPTPEEEPEPPIPGNEPEEEPIPTEEPFPDDDTNVEIGAIFGGSGCSLCGLASLPPFSFIFSVYLIGWFPFLILFAHRNDKTGIRDRNIENRS